MCDQWLWYFALPYKSEWERKSEFMVIYDSTAPTQ